MGMRERATELNGELKIDSVPGRGTEISFVVSVAT
jgi:signal transduction histidine kinase